MKKRYYLLQEGEIIAQGDEIYMAEIGEWKSLDKFVGDVVHTIGAPMRRILEEQYEHEFSYIVATTSGKDLEDGNNKDSYTVFRDDEDAYLDASAEFNEVCKLPTTLICSLCKVLKSTDY